MKKSNRMIHVADTRYGYEVRLNGLWVAGGLVPTAKEALQIVDHIEAFYDTGTIEATFYIRRRVGHDYLQRLAYGEVI